jgi:3-keto-disaccharide hydrolase
MKTVALALLALASPLLADPQHSAPNSLSPLEREAGWQLLFDGETTSGWRSVKQAGFPAEGWEVADGALHHTLGGGDIVSEQLFGDFELEFEWKVAEGTNSGVKYMVAEADAGSAFGPEYQVLDDAAHPEVKDPAHHAAALYDLMPAGGKELRPVGEYNEGRIVSRDGRIEHWLNGTRVVDLDTGHKTWSVMHASSKYAGTPDFARTGRGRIALQDHGGEVWFRDLRIRELPAAKFKEVELLPGSGLEAWTEYGDAIYTREERTILGAIGGGGQSFLLSKQSFGDFIFEVDVKTELPGNSGIQIRCHQRENGRPFGYQIEIDSSERSWSGGLFDEARRGWLDSLEHNEAGRQAFTFNEWNRFRIECIGPWIRASVNGVPTADYIDLADIEGVFGLQVHSGNNTRVRWREPRVWDLGRRSWGPGHCVTQTGNSDNPVRATGALSVGRDDGQPLRVGIGGGDFRGNDSTPAAFVARFTLSSSDRVRLNIGDASFDLSSSDKFEPTKSNEVGLCRDGGSTTVILNGRPLANASELPESSQGISLLIEGDSASCELDELEVLGPRK